VTTWLGQSGIFHYCCSCRLLEINFASVNHSDLYYLTIVFQIQLRLKSGPIFAKKAGFRPEPEPNSGTALENSHVECPTVRVWSCVCQEPIGMDTDDLLDDPVYNPDIASGLMFNQLVISLSNTASFSLLIHPPPSNGRHLIVWTIRGDYLNCSVLYCVLQNFLSPFIFVFVLVLLFYCTCYVRCSFCKGTLSPFWLLITDYRHTHMSSTCIGAC